MYMCCQIKGSIVMDLQTLVQALSNTLDPSLGKQAEAWLEEVRILNTYAIARVLYVNHRLLCSGAVSMILVWAPCHI